MGHGHTHGGGIPAVSAAARDKGRLAWALALTLTYMGAEVVGRLLTGSLALLAGAAYMVTDAKGWRCSPSTTRARRRRPARASAPCASKSWRHWPTRSCCSG